MNSDVATKSPCVDSIDTVKQLRGKKLEARLIELLRYWCKDESGRGVKLCYTQAAFAKYAGVSRETIRSKQRLLDVVLSELSQQRRLSVGATGLEDARKQNLKLKEEVDELKKKLGVLRNHHLNIFSALLRNSSSLADLIVGEVYDTDVVICKNCGCKIYVCS